MIQRSPTTIVSVEPAAQLVFSRSIRKARAGRTATS